jgi:hypothetical protein
MKLTTHLHLVPRSRVHGDIPPLPNTPSWYGAQLKKESTGRGEGEENGDAPAKNLQTMTDFGSSKILDFQQCI